MSATILNATASNENTVEAAVDITFGNAGQKADKATGKVAGYGATGSATGILAATNKVNALARAEIVFTGARGAVEAGGVVTVSAFDEAGVAAQSTVVQDVATSNTLAGITDVLNQIVIPGDYDYTTESGVRHIIPEPVTLPVGELGGIGTQVRVGQKWVDAWLLAHPDGTAPVVGDVYRYIGPERSIDLGSITDADFTNAALWERVVAGQDDLGRFYPQIGNLTDSDARSIGIVFLLNDVRSSVTAQVLNAFVTGTDVSVTAGETAWIEAEALLNVKATGGSFYGSGSVLAVAAQITTNRVLASATALVKDSVIVVSGDVSVTAFNDSGIDATLLTSAYSGEQAIGVVLAFNSVGWTPSTSSSPPSRASSATPPSSTCSAPSSRRRRAPGSSTPSSASPARCSWRRRTPPTSARR